MSVRFSALIFPNGPVVTTGPVHRTLQSGDASRLQASVAIFLPGVDSRSALPMVKAAPPSPERAIARGYLVLADDVSLNERACTSPIVVYHR